MIIIYFFLNNKMLFRSIRYLQFYKRRPVFKKPIKNKNNKCYTDFLL